MAALLLALPACGWQFSTHWLGTADSSDLTGSTGEPTATSDSESGAPEECSDPRWSSAALGLAAEYDGFAIAASVCDDLVVGGRCSGAACRPGSTSDSFVLYVPRGANEPLWAHEATGSGNDNLTAIESVAIARDGDVFVAGTLAGDMLLAGTSISATGPHDDFVARFAPDGALRWLVAGGGAQSETATDLLLERDGAHILVSGDINGATATVSRWTVDGDLKWTSELGAASVALSLDHLGSDAAVIGAMFSDSVTLGALPPVTGAGDQDMLIAAFDPRSDSVPTWQWARGLGGAGYDSLVDLAANADGDTVWVVGECVGQINELGVTSPAGTACDNMKSFAVAQLRADRSADWLVSFGSSSIGFNIFSMARGETGPLLSGNFDDPLEFIDPSFSNGNINSLFVMALDNSGAVEDGWYAMAGGESRGYALTAVRSGFAVTGIASNVGFWEGNPFGTQGVYAAPLLVFVDE